MGAGDAVQSQAAFVVEARKAANGVEARALLGQAQGYDFGMAAFSGGIFVVQFQPAVGVEGVADFIKNTGAYFRRQQGLGLADHGTLDNHSRSLFEFKIGRCAGADGGLPSACGAGHDRHGVQIAELARGKPLRIAAERQARAIYSGQAG